MKREVQAADDNLQQQMEDMNGQMGKLKDTLSFLQSGVADLNKRLDIFTD